MTRVIGIDPAPGKQSVYYDGQDGPKKLSPGDMPQQIQEWKDNDDSILICWDAPLTGPADPDRLDSYRIGDYTMRPIDAFFRSSGFGFKTPPGISVLPYGGCPHWTITRAALGLPRVGSYDAAWDQLPFSLISQGGPPPMRNKQKLVVEVHPAVAMWLWSREKAGEHHEWKYKGDAEAVAKMWSLLRMVLPPSAKQCIAPSLWVEEFTPRDDDSLDAIVAWLLGELWLRGKGEVILLGDRSAGSLLLPDSPGMRKAFRSFILERTTGSTEAYG